ncbi:phycobilisome linker polypeptide [Roseofilum sp. BLCC_M91]|uniref:Phycobilisome linker polypeptide n=1 Tax=Roseofilum halophilum BLCC-M91 TaxID=3022259 RepID=A0ABT7BG28_9CYAN|nr:phycobilisome linker polypeptide [Roseofilum halophilum]MDJ1177486.1 phycobilisome linker polypeptide [Roseofilum halophilum BLCC-M91]
MPTSSLAGRTSSASSNRLFQFEVVGLNPGNMENMNCSIRRSGSAMITVPYNRMNQEMRRITRLGGTITNIVPLNFAVSSEDEA